MNVPHRQQQGTVRTFIHPSPAPNFIEVSTGEVRTGGTGTVLTASALGSCIAVSALDPEAEQGCMAHVMLPGRAPSETAHDRLRYAENAIDELLRLLEAAGADRDRLCIVIAGGGNVLERSDDRICGQNIRSVADALTARRLAIRAQDVGGTLRRKVHLDPGAGRIACIRGDGPELILWRRQLPQT